jgi:hypothetical protein
MIPALKKLLHRNEDARRDSADTQLHASVQGSGGVEEEYREAILKQLRQLGVSPNCVSVEMQSTGPVQGAREGIAGYIRITRWDRKQAVRILLSLPLIETKVRRQFEETWVQEVSELTGLWLQAGAELQQKEALGELWDLLVRIEQPEAS